MGNGALPHGPSFRAHPRLYHNVALNPSCRGLLIEGEADINAAAR
jgi:hypothetical protein